ncbi:MAG: NAD-dependent epimerase/dehydratase family protein [Novibacillus thermophilus]
MQKIVVTGGAGFIGSHLVERLLSLGHEVWTVDDLSTGNRRYLHRVIDHERHTFVHGSTDDRNLVKRVMTDCDVVYHLAAVLGVKNTVENPLKVIEGNLDGTRNVLEEAYARKAKVILASTSEVYGKNDRLPFHEDSDRVLGAPSVHRWCYATAKAIDEHLAFAYAEQGLPVTVVRYFNAYGPRQTASAYGGVISKFIRAAVANEPLTIHGDGEQSRCFTYIDDTVSGTVAAMRRTADGMAINIGSDQPITIRNLAAKIIHLADSASSVRYIPYEQVYGRGFEDMRTRIPDLSRAKAVLNWNPRINLQTGLLKTIHWYQRVYTGEDRDG